MDTIRRRFPTRQEAILLFAICAFPVFVWSILMYLHEVPAYLRRMNSWDVIGVFAYAEAFALFESFLVLCVVVFVCIALPRKFFKDKVVAQGAIFMFITFIWIAPVHYQIQILELLNWNMLIYYILVLFWVVSFFVAIIGLSLLIRRSRKVEDGINALVDRLAVLSAVYILIGVVSFFIVIYRNLA